MRPTTLALGGQIEDFHGELRGLILPERTLVGVERIPLVPRLQTSVFAAVILALLASPALAESEITVQLEIHTTDVWKGVHGPTEQTAGAGQHIGVGGSATMYYALDSFDEQGNAFANGDGLIGSEQSTDRRDVVKKYAHVWWVEARVLSIGPEASEIELVWTHTYSSTRGVTKKVAGDVRQIRLKEGERHVFDFYRQTKSDVQYDANEVLGISFKKRDDSDP